LYTPSTNTQWWGHIRLFTLHVWLQVNVLPLSFMFGLCVLFLLVCMLLQLRLASLAEVDEARKAKDQGLADKWPHVQATAGPVHGEN
jgi:hypothetical protein